LEVAANETQNISSPFYSPSKTAKESLFYIESVGHYCCDKSFYEDSYYKRNYYLIYVVSGKGYVHSQNEKFLVTPGKLIYLNLHQPYKYYSHKKDPWQFLWILFGGKDAEWYYNLITNRTRLIFNLDRNSKIPDYFKDAFDLFEQKVPFLEFRVSNLINTLLTELYIEVMTKSNTNYEQDSEFPDPVKKVMDYIEQNYFRKITLDELASLTYLNPYYLLKLFKRYTGYTPNEYINKFRIDYSKKLLISSELTIEQIALFLGFNTHSYFSRVFKSKNGLTPELFRKKYKEKI